MADLQGAFTHRATLMDANYRDAMRGQHAEFTGALDNIISHHAVDSDSRDHQRNAGEHGQQRHRETLPRDRVGHDFFERTNRADGLVFIDCINRGTERAQQRGRRAFCPDHDIHPAERDLRERFV